MKTFTNNPNQVWGFGNDKYIAYTEDREGMIRLRRMKNISVIGQYYHQTDKSFYAEQYFFPKEAFSDVKRVLNPRPQKSLRLASTRHRQICPTINDLHQKCKSGHE